MQSFVQTYDEWISVNVHCVVAVVCPYYTPTRREGAMLQSPCPSVHTFVADISASTGRNDFIFDMWLWHGDLYRVSLFQVYCTSTSCLPCDLKLFMCLRHFLVTCVEIYTNLTQMNEWGYS